MASTHKASGPTLACEITPERVIAARKTDDGVSLDSYTARAIPAGVVVPRLGEANISNGDALKQAIADVLTTVGARTRDIVAILPDASVRIAILDFDTLPDKKADADGVVRFRLKKALPFDVDESVVSYDVFRSEGKVQVVAAIVLASVLNEYEGIFRDLGYAPGFVVPSALAALGNVEEGEPVMVIKSDATTTTVAIVGNGQLLLFRTLENPSAGPPKAEQLAEDVHSSMVFFEDTYNMKVSRILVGGSLEAENIGSTLESQTGVRVQDLVASRHLGAARPNFPASALAGVVGALLG
jgi:type IV pilus assembly protein PilM